MTERLAGLDARAPGIPDTVLASYLSGRQDGEQWALIDNLNADEARDVAKAAIELLVAANKCVALASIALDEMTDRKTRFVAHDAANAVIKPYLTTLGERFIGRSQ